LPAQPYASAAELEVLIDRDLGWEHDAAWAGLADPRHYVKGPRTDADGRVLLPALVPGALYRLARLDGTTRDFRVEAGKGVDLGDVRIQDPARPKSWPEPRWFK